MSNGQAGLIIRGGTEDNEKEIIEKPLCLTFHSPLIFVADSYEAPTVCDPGSAEAGATADADTGAGCVPGS